jgi:hypothetical protein
MSSPSQLCNDLTAEEMSFEYESFKHIVLLNKRELSLINAGASISRILSKRDREHMWRLGIISLDTSKEKKYILSDAAKQVLDNNNSSK